MAASKFFALPEQALSWTVAGGGLGSSPPCLRLNFCFDCEQTPEFEVKLCFVIDRCTWGCPARQGGENQREGVIRKKAGGLWASFLLSWGFPRTGKDLRGPGNKLHHKPGF